MSRLAIDVVLLPPQPIMDLAIDFNRKLHAGNSDSLILGTRRNLPHISMVMGCLSTNRLNEATLRLNAIATYHQPLDLCITTIRIDKSGSNSVVSFEIGRSGELVSLHESIVREFTALLTQDAVDEDLNDPPITISSINWINRFIPHACFDNFWPHITLGFGNYSGDFEPIRFSASRLAICHLGDHCTCAKVLEEVVLSVPRSNQ